MTLAKPWQTTKHIQHFLIATGCALCSGCFLFSGSSKNNQNQNNVNLQSNVPSLTSWSQVITNVTPDNVDADVVNALAECNCAPAFSERYADALILRRGVIPEIMVPAVRESIRSNSKLKLIQDLGGSFAGILRRMLLSDDALLDEIRSGIYDLVEKSTGWKSLKTKPFRYSLFSRLTPMKADSESDWNKRFDTTEQATRWNFFFAVDGLWQGAPAINGNDHSLELAQVTLIASEMQYIFGLSKDPSGKPYGGLTLNTENPTGDGTKEFDPRVSYTVPRYISGRYEAGIPTGFDGVDVATNSRESWINSVSSYSLEEQSKLWSASARMLNRTRPRSRTFTQPLYDRVNGILPTEVYSMSLIFLASIENLLTKQFISEKNLTITTLHAVPNSDQNPALNPTSGGNSSSMAPVADLTGKARVLAMSRLLQALILWYDELQKIDDIDVSQDVKTQLISAPPSMKKAMQFTASQILSEAIRAIPNAPEKPEYVEVAFKENPILTNDIAAAAEVLTTLARMSRQVLHSSFLEHRLTALINNFSTQTLARVASAPPPSEPNTVSSTVSNTASNAASNTASNTASNAASNTASNAASNTASNAIKGVKPSDVFWTLALLNEWALHNPNPNEMPWLEATHAQLKSVVSLWDSNR